MEFVRRWVRRHSRPIPRRRARYMYDKLSLVYYMSAWTAAGLALFKLCTDNGNILPHELNVYVSPEEQLKPSVCKAADLVRKHEDDMNVRVVTFKNFEMQSNEPYKARTLMEVTEEIKTRAEEDFFGNTEDKEGKENLSM